MAEKEVVPAYARMQEKYPEAIKLLMERLNHPEPLLVKHCRENNVPGNDMYTLIQAAIYFHNKTKTDL